MKIGNPVDAVPDRGGRQQRGKYIAIYDAVIAASGAWVPVEFKSPRQAKQLRIAAETHRTLAFEVKQRGATVYIRVPAGLRAVIA